ncbi:hypothetical protein CMV_023770 [Castanea mollissima]|uniref:Uncharacterized protein n=1 Tax=Castanea mollissima TaxID=60419 RepID=A0A8J4QFG1_9ROSI|nr:hypothetical protein CMV_023770 [Castanea mollissima]
MKGWMRKSEILPPRLWQSASKSVQKIYARHFLRPNSTNKTVGRSDSLYHTTNQNQNGAFTPEKVQVLQYLQSQSGTFPARSFSQDGLWGTAIGFQENLVLARNLVWGFKLPGGLEGNAPWLKQRKIDVSQKYGHSIENDNYLDRDFLYSFGLLIGK